MLLGKKEEKSLIHSSRYSLNSSSMLTFRCNYLSFLELLIVTRFESEHIIGYTVIQLRDFTKFALHRFSIHRLHPFNRYF